jgi:hypothetical protein
LEAGTIADVFEHFDSSRMSALDDRIVGDDWYVDDERVNYVRRNREAFQQVK